MSDIDVSAVCSETVYTGPISGPDESATLDSNVSNAGLIQGDEILAVDHTRLQNLTLSDWRSHWATQAANNQPVLLTIRRQGFEIDLPVSTDQRNSIESAFASTQAFRCELRDGRLEEVSVYRESENTLYYRQNDSAWTSITKPNSGTHFMVGIFDGTAGIQTVNTSFVETTAPLSQHFLGIHKHVLVTLADGLDILFLKKSFVVVRDGFIQVTFFTMSNPSVVISLNIFRV